MTWLQVVAGAAVRLPADREFKVVSVRNSENSLNYKQISRNGGPKDTSQEQLDRLQPKAIVLGGGSWPDKWDRDIFP